MLPHQKTEEWWLWLQVVEIEIERTATGNVAKTVSCLFSYHVTQA